MSVLDLIDHSDRFRRKSPGERAGDAQAAAAVALTREFLVAMTYVEYPPGNPLNRPVLERVKTIIGKLDETLRASGAEQIILPISGGGMDAEVLERDVLPGTPFVLQAGPYTTDNSALGMIDSDVRTALDEGIRGLADIDSDLKYRWDHEMRQRNQLSMDLG